MASEELQKKSETKTPLRIKFYEAFWHLEEAFKSVFGEEVLVLHRMVRHSGKHDTGPGAIYFPNRFRNHCATVIIWKSKDNPEQLVLKKKKSAKREFGGPGRVFGGNNEVTILGKKIENQG